MWALVIGLKGNYELIPYGNVFRIFLPKYALVPLPI